MSRKPVGTICIIDPDRDLHAILAATLALEGYRVVSSSRARDASKKMDLQRFAAIFIDPGKPQDRLDDVIRQAATPGTMNAKTPMILMGSIDTLVPTEATTHVAAVLQKPFTIDECLGTLRAVTRPS